ncbi:MAG: hypothetical protein IKW12_04140 [Clostridia bacterium]|nr:hypothetical protein [Clostridia bacterium]
MRELTVDFSQENPLSKGAEAGYIGENNATQLIIKPGSKILNSGCSKFAVVFLTQGQIFRTEQFDPASELKILLGAHLTQDHYLSLQIEGYSDRNSLIYKSPMVTKIHFMPSIEGNESEIDPKDYQLQAQIALNTKSRHVHGNQSVLSNINQKNGELTYSGVPVCKQPKTKTLTLSYENSEVDVVITASGFKYLDLISYSSLEDFAIPANSEILSVELQINSPEYPEWIDLREMICYDPENPYIINLFKPFTDSETDVTVFCRVNFISSLNKTANHLAAFRLKNVRITYIDGTVN